MQQQTKQASAYTQIAVLCFVVALFYFGRLFSAECREETTYNTTSLQSLPTYHRHLLSFRGCHYRGLLVDDSRSLLGDTHATSNRGEEKSELLRKGRGQERNGHCRQDRAGVTAKKQQQPSRNPKYDIPLTAAAASPESGEECAARVKSSSQTHTTRRRIQRRRPIQRRQRRR